MLKANPAELVGKAAQLVGELRIKDRELETINAKMAASQLENLKADAKMINGIKIVTAVLKGTGADTLRIMTDRFRETEPNAVIVLAGITQGKINFAAACGSDAVNRGAHAGNLLKTAAKLTGGGGGGRPDSATAGGRDISKLDEAMATVEKAVAGLKNQ